MHTDTAKPVDSALVFPFKFDVEEFKLDSINEYGAGDCWGLVNQFSNENGSVHIAIDSLNCGVYGNHFSYYLLKGTIIKVAHLKESTTLSGGDLNDTLYVLTEEIFDYRETPFVYYSKSDTVTESNADISHLTFIKEELGDFQTSYEHLVMKYEGAWEAEVDY